MASRVSRSPSFSSRCTSTICLVMSLNPRISGIARGDLPGCVAQHAGQTLSLGHRRLDLVQPEVVRDLLGVVDDVVERRGQVEDVLAVDRRDDRLVEPADDVMGDLIAVVLAGQDVPARSDVSG